MRRERPKIVPPVRRLVPHDERARGRDRSLLPRPDARRSLAKRAVPLLLPTGRSARVGGHRPLAALRGRSIRHLLLPAARPRAGRGIPDGIRGGIPVHRVAPPHPGPPAVELRAGGRDDRVDPHRRSHDGRTLDRRAGSLRVAVRLARPVRAATFRRRRGREAPARRLRVDPNRRAARSLGGGADRRGAGAPRAAVDAAPGAALRPAGRIPLLHCRGRQPDPPADEWRTAARRRGLVAARDREGSCLCRYRLRVLRNLRPRGGGMEPRRPAAARCRRCARGSPWPARGGRRESPASTASSLWLRSG